MPQVNDADDLPVFINREVRIGQHPVRTDGIRTGIAADTLQPGIIAFRAVQQLTAVNDRFPVRKELLPESHRRFPVFFFRPDQPDPYLFHLSFSVC